ncbi:hypothetical protein C2W62_14335 [Candidatus Entotheonella serta]|nr:hypothetical protein C2W62_14335 [Candidatus Entotheonella serta]
MFRQASKHIYRWVTLVFLTCLALVVLFYRGPNDETDTSKKSVTMSILWFDIIGIYHTNDIKCPMV